ncbi:MAG: Ku protein [Actinomyces sp.]|nr:MAG: Ku protein [Actinomyces sp.]
MPRAIWSGAISFGLVTIPVRLYPAVKRRNVRFHQVDRETGARIRQKRVSDLDSTEVPWDRIVKGYELPGGRVVTVTDDELASLDPAATRTIDIEEFVDGADIDPIYYDSAYHVVPDPSTAKPYKLLTTAMERAGKVAIAHFVMRTKQYLAAVRPREGTLLLSTMVYADEVVPVGEIEGFDALAGIEIDERELAMASQLIATLEADFEPERHRDTHREAVLALLERKAAGAEPEPVAAPAAADDTVIDLMAALEASVAAAKAARERHPTARAVRRAASGGAKKPAAKKPAAVKKKAGAKKAAATKKPAAKKKPAEKKAATTTASRKKPAAAKKKTAAKKTAAKRRTAAHGDTAVTTRVRQSA